MNQMGPDLAGDEHILEAMLIEGFDNIPRAFFQAD